MPTFTALAVTPLTARRLNAPMAELCAAGEICEKRGAPVIEIEVTGTVD
jgi:hypothetical protein